MVNALLIVVALIIGLDLMATFVVARSGMYEREQIVYQLVLIWLLPLIGATVCWSLVISEGRRSNRHGEGNDPDDDDDVLHGCEDANSSTHDGGGSAAHT